MYNMSPCIVTASVTFVYTVNGLDSCSERRTEKQENCGLSDRNSRRNRWLEDASVPRGEVYAARFAALAAAGQDVHGEATFVATLPGHSVLDAGCGTGRVAIELARRGYAVVGVDLDPGMLEVARRNAPQLEWYEGDIATTALTPPGGSTAPRRFDTIVMAGNVMIFLAPGSEPAAIMNLARHLAPGGLLVAGFQLLPGKLSLRAYDQFATQAGLALVERWATWDRQPWSPGSDYAVSVHRAIATAT
jgi:SAM-dependent methyltransferase